MSGSREDSCIFWKHLRESYLRAYKRGTRTGDAPLEGAEKNFSPATPATKFHENNKQTIDDTGGYRGYIRIFQEANEHTE
jgi:hypothetical protein